MPRKDLSMIALSFFLTRCFFNMYTFTNIYSYFNYYNETNKGKYLRDKTI